MKSFLTIHKRIIIIIFCIILPFCAFRLNCIKQNKTGERATWKLEASILGPGEKGSFDEIAVKDPSIVFYAGKWRLFYTAHGQDEYSTGYVSSKILESLQFAPRVQLQQICGKTCRYTCAPQVFFFKPQNLWYLIYQTKDSNYQPVYSTTKFIDKPESWTEPLPLVKKDDSEKWIDFWIICDDTTAYFFYTRAHSDVYVKTTNIQDFPNGFRNPIKTFSGVHEAVHIYKAKGRNEYHMIYELNKEGERSFGLAIANRLSGPWKKVTDEYATGNQLRHRNDSEKWTEEVSHGEVIRGGYDQRLEYDPENTVLIIQGLLKSQHTGPYSDLPWRLGLIKENK